MDYRSRSRLVDLRVRMLKLKELRSRGVKLQKPEQWLQPGKQGKYDVGSRMLRMHDTGGS